MRNPNEHLSMETSDLETWSTIIATVIPVFAIIGVGFIYGRWKSIPAEPISDLLVWIMIPCLVLGSIGSKPLDLKEVGSIATSALIIMAGCGLATWLLFFRSRFLRAALLPTMFMNSANMAFPLALLMFGEQGLSRQLIFYVAINLVHVTVGIWIARGKNGMKEVFRLPMVYAAALAIALASTGIILPETMVKSLNLVGQATIPIMLLMLGIRLRTVRLFHLGPALLASLIRLLVGFGLGIFAVWLLGLHGYARDAVLLGSVMPAAVLNFILSEKYKLEQEFVATTVVLSTVLSFATTPLALWLMVS